MTQQTDIKYFDGQQIRTVWDAGEGKMYFSIVDVVQALTEQSSVRGASTYWAVLKKRIKESKSNELLTNCKQLKLLATDGKMRLTDVAAPEQLLEIIQSLPSQKVENFRKWLESFDNNSDIDKGEIIMYQPDETIKLEVRLDNETVWLTQQQMAELFETTRNNVTTHIDNIFKEHELEGDSVSKESLLTATDGKKYRTKLYNLDVIISVGYRVKSLRGTQFRQWANRVLKEYLLKGYSLNQRLDKLEQRMNQAENKIDFFVRTSLPTVEGIFYDGQIFDAFAQIINLVKKAKKSIVIIDNYVDETVLTMLSKKQPGVSVTIYTKQYPPDLQLAVSRFNAQYPPITVNLCQKVHDCVFLI